MPVRTEYQADFIEWHPSGALLVVLNNKGELQVNILQLDINNIYEDNTSLTLGFINRVKYTIANCGDSVMQYFDVNYILSLNPWSGVRLTWTATFFSSSC